MEITTDTKNAITLFDRANSQLQNTVFQRSHHHLLCIFASNEQELHAALIKICTSATDPLWLLPMLKHTIHNLTVLTATAGLHKCSSSIDECQWVPFFSTRRTSMTHLCFTCTFISDVILSDCLSAAICHMATTWNTGGKVQPLLLYHQHPPLTSRAPMPWNRRHYFRSSKAQCVTVWFLSALFLSVESTALTKGEAFDWCWWQKGKYWM